MKAFMTLAKHMYVALSQITPAEAGPMRGLEG